MRKYQKGLIVALALTAFSACGPKVDCKVLKKKLEDCTVDLIWAVRKKEKENFDKNPDKAAMLKKLEEVKKQFLSSLDKEVYQKCKKHSGRAKDAKQINECLKKESCKEFAECFASYLKPKS